MATPNIDPWPFADPPMVATISTRDVIDGENPILFVYRNSEDGMWEFLGTQNRT
jgi:hypothetical protein